SSDLSGTEPCSGHEDVAQGLDHLIDCCAPGLGFGIDLFAGMDDIRVVQRHIGLAVRGSVTCVERRIPLLVLVAEPDHHHVGLLDQASAAAALRAWTMSASCSVT